jgi:hypothetical protein
MILFRPRRSEWHGKSEAKIAVMSFEVVAIDRFPVLFLCTFSVVRLVSS